MNRIVLGDNLKVLREMKAGSMELIYVDPPFNTGKRQSRTQMKTVRDEAGDRVGFGGRRYRTEVLAKQTGGAGYGDRFDDFLGFLRPRLEEAHRVLSATGSLFFHIDYREVHYCKVMLDEIFGRECFQNEIIWAYDYGARANEEVAGQARQHSLVHEGSGALHRSTWTRATAFRTWLRGWWARRRRRAARRRRMCGGTRSSRRRARRRPAMRRRSRWESWSGS